MTIGPIPRIIHRVWIGPPMPPEFAAYGDRWAALNPDWEQRLWGEEAADLLPADARALYDAAADYVSGRYVPRFRSNLLRYAILHAHGGVYVDCDLAPLRPLNDLPDLDRHVAFAGWEKQNTWAGNTILGSVAGHRLWAALLAGAPESARRHRGKPSPHSTGPQYLTRALAGEDTVHLYDEHIFYPVGWRDLNRPVDLNGAFTDHQWCALRGQVSVVVPYRGDGAHRDRHLDLLRTHYALEHPAFQFHVEHDPDPSTPFNKGALATAGAEKVMGDLLIVSDGDLWVDPVRLRRAVAMVRDDGGWVIPYNEVRRLTDDASDDVYAGREPGLDWPLDRAAYAGVPGGGVWVVRRDDYLRVGGMDPRFAGWGGEDDVWGWWADQFIRRHVRLPGPLWHLWHPQAPNLRLNLNLWNRYQAARHNPAALRGIRPDVFPDRQPQPELQPQAHTGGRPVLVGRRLSLPGLGRGK